MKELDDLSNWWWNLPDEERIAHRREFGMRMDTDPAFRQTARILLALRDENEALKEVLRQRDEGLREIAVRFRDAREYAHAVLAGEEQA